MEIKRDEHVIKEGEFMGMKGFIVTEFKEILFNENEVENSPLKINNVRTIEKVEVNGATVYLVKEKADLFLTGDVFLNAIDNTNKNKYALEADIKHSRAAIVKIKELVAIYMAWKDKADEFSAADYKKRQAKKRGVNTPISKEEEKYIN